MEINQIGPDRVRVSGCRGSNPPGKHKVCINLATGYRNGMDLVLTGLDIEAKAKLSPIPYSIQSEEKDQFDEVSVNLYRTDKKNPNQMKKLRGNFIHISKI